MFNCQEIAGDASLFPLDLRREGRGLPLAKGLECRFGRSALHLTCVLELHSGKLLESIVQTIGSRIDSRETRDSKAVSM